MTYCVAMRLNAGLIFMSDTRTECVQWVNWQLNQQEVIEDVSVVSYFGFFGDN